MTADEITALTALAREAGLSALEVDRDGVHLRLRFGTENVAPAASVPPPAQQVHHAVAPCVGRFLPCHPLENGAAAGEGSEVAEGQVLGYVRSGTLLQPVRSPKRGRIQAVLVTEGDGVGFGDALIAVS